MAGTDRADGRGVVRIIGGRWRGRRLRFPAEPGLRPTSDRTRETLFNWLSPVIAGARCVDLFAGSGALGLEALSRGAAYCDFVDVSPRAVAALREHLQRLGAEDSGCCHLQSASGFLNRATGSYDLVFIDPPFNCDLVIPVCTQLAANDLLHPDSLIYVETAASELLMDLPRHWSVHREKRASGVAYRLYRAS